MEDTILAMLKNSGSFGIAIACLYLGWKGALWARSTITQRRLNNVADGRDNPGAPSGSNPGDWAETTGRMVSPDYKPVTQTELNAHCKAIHAVTDSKFDSITDSLSDTSTKIDKMETKLDSVNACVGEIRESVAVLKDRTERGK